MSSEYESLSLAQKESMCRSLLAEFGAKNVSLQGTELHHSCVLPFGLHRHGDSKPSASINIDRMVASCFVCGGGTLGWWVASCRGTGVREAVKWVRSHTTLDGTNRASLVKFFEDIYAPSAKPLPMPKYSPAVLEPWKLIHPYLTEVRHIPVKTLLKFVVGFNPDTNRVIIPHFWKDDLVGWVSRRIVNDRSLRYQYTPSFPKKETIYNYSRDSTPIIVESQMSALRHTHHVSIEATFGASVTPGQVRLLGAHPKVALFFDNDPAGWNATKSVGAELSAYTDVRVVPNPYKEDAGDLPDEVIDDLLSKIVPFSTWQPPSSLVSYET